MLHTLCYISKFFQLTVCINGEYDKAPVEELHLDDISSEDSNSDDGDLSHRRKANFQGKILIQKNKQLFAGEL